MTKYMKQVIVAILVIGSVYGIYAYFNKPWQLSLYGDGVTLMRIDYKSEEACLSAGSAYFRDGTTQYKRFDCGYKCSYVSNENDLTNSPICLRVCDSYGCK